MSVSHTTYRGIVGLFMKDVLIGIYKQTLLTSLDIGRRVTAQKKHIDAA